MALLIMGGVIILIFVLIYSKNKVGKSRSWTRDYVIFNVGSIFDVLLKDYDTSIILEGKFIIIGDNEEICWIRKDSNLASDVNVLIDLQLISEGNKFVLENLLQDAELEDGTSRTMSLLLSAKVVHRCLMKTSVYYRNLFYKDSSFG